MLDAAAAAAVRAAINPERLLQTAVELVGVPSPTRSAGAVADRLAAILAAAGFAVERPVADWPDAPAVVVRYATGRPGRILQFDGHLDTVHLPFAAPQVSDGVLTGSGASDMKGGIAAFVEALRALAEQDALPGGGILLTAHDHHEGPWGDRRQLVALIRDGYVGDGVLLPEYLAGSLPVAGRGSAIFDIRIERPGAPVHEVLRPPDTPDVIAAGAAVVQRLAALHARLCGVSAPYAGHDSVFVGAIHAGEMYNQSPRVCTLAGVRRWVTPGHGDVAVAELDAILATVAQATNTRITAEYNMPGDAFRLDPASTLARSFQTAHHTVTGVELPLGGKAFVDDGNLFAGQAGIPAITHGPDAHGAHTTHEAVAVAELVRVAHVYVLTALGFCAADA
jgi:acetylornithine deacetylase/succinyl-diaminopimelate desuccinylase-like protein